MFEKISEEIAVVFERDPAARSTWEVVTCYPGFHALLVHRLSHGLWTRGFKWLARWVSALGWQALLNRKGTAWRNLDVAQRAAVGDAGSATALMLQHASVIRRPVVEWADGRITVGFDARTWSERC